MQTLLLDVDYTLYPKGTGPFLQVSARIDLFAMNLLKLPKEQVHALRKRYVSQYGSTLGGLMQEHGLDPLHYLDFVHDVPIDEMLTRDVRLQDALAALPYPIIVFSNGARAYVGRVLQVLEVQSYFKDIFAIEDMEYIPKPRVSAYEKLIEKYGERPDTYIMVDDMRDNILTARNLGMQGILVEQRCNGDHLCIPDIYALPAFLRQNNG